MVDSKVNLPVNFKGSQPQIQRIKKQDEDDHWISEEELYTEGSSDEENSTNSTKKHSSKGTSREEIMKKEEDLQEMRDAITKLGETLLSGKAIDDIYGVGKAREALQKELDPTGESERIAAVMSEVREFDRRLKVKAEEIKIVRLERMREAEETRRLIVELSKEKTSDAVKNNSEHFLRLLEADGNEDPGDDAELTKPLEKTLKKKLVDSAKKPATFIERNIQLAKCGDGVLSLTDEEKLRLKAVLKDVDESGDAGQDDPTAVNKETIYIPTDNQYVLDGNTRKVIVEIDRKLEEHQKTKVPFPSVRTAHPRTERQNCVVAVKGKGKGKIQTLFGDELKRLKELDKLLNSITTTTNEVIDPLQEDDLQYLIEESRQKLTLARSMESFDTIDTADLMLSPDTVPSKEKITELVSAAKTIMPNFRYRYEKAASLTPRIHSFAIAPSQSSSTSSTISDGNSN